MKKCPVCNKKLVDTVHKLHLPFCSERCRLIDLGDWFSENHKIPSDIPDQLIDGLQDGEVTKH